MSKTRQRVQSRYGLGKQDAKNKKNIYKPNCGSAYRLGYLHGVCERYDKTFLEAKDWCSIRCPSL